MTRCFGSLAVLLWLTACGARSELTLDVDGDAAVGRDAALERDASVERDAASDRDAMLDRDGAVDRDAAVERDAALDVDAAVAPDSPLDLKAGASHTCVVIADGTVRCWGFNFDGQISPASWPTYPFGVAVNGVSDVVQLALGSVHSCARATTGTVTCWGKTTSGQRGNGTLDVDRAPTRVNDIDDAIDLWAGGLLTCAGRSGGAVSCWGPHSPGRDSLPQPNVIDVPELAGALELAIGDGHGCARWSDGRVSCWGYSAYGQLGDGRSGDMSIQAIPVDVLGITDAVEIGAGNGFSCARLSNRKVKCWGRNYFGQIGSGSYGDNVLVPAFVEGLDDAVDLTVGEGHSCARLADGSVRCWGINESGQAGLSDTPGWNARATPVPDLTDTVAITVGNTHSCAQIRDGRVRCWGNGQQGQLGNGDTDSQGPVPVTAMW